MTEIFVFGFDGVLVREAADGNAEFFPGVPAFLRRLKETGAGIGVVSERNSSDVRRILSSAEGIPDVFDFVAGCGTENFSWPSAEFLGYVKARIEAAAGRSCGPENVLLVTDRADCIAAGKEYGCATCGILDGRYGRETVSAMNPDFSFYVMAEMEKFIGILVSDCGAGKIRGYAAKNSVPVVRDDGAEFICRYIREHDVRNVLEIGGAVGYSAIKFAQAAPGIHVTTVEIDSCRAEKACENVAALGLDDAVTVVCCDALEFETDGLFDLIFIDAAKSQYIRFFNRFCGNLAQGGVVISDNLSFHGMVDDITLTHNKSTRQLVGKIRRYREFLESSREFETEFLNIGDGISVTRKRAAV